VPPRGGGSWCRLGTSLEFWVLWLMGCCEAWEVRGERFGFIILLRGYRLVQTTDSFNSLHSCSSVLFIRFLPVPATCARDRDPASGTKLRPELPFPRRHPSPVIRSAVCRTSTINPDCLHHSTATPTGGRGIWGTPSLTHSSDTLTAPNDQHFFKYRNNGLDSDQ
jgi:hypothetical protein